MRSRPSARPELAVQRAIADGLDDVRRADGGAVGTARHISRSRAAREAHGAPTPFAKSNLRPFSVSELGTWRSLLRA